MSAVVPRNKAALGSLCDLHGGDGEELNRTFSDIDDCVIDDLTECSFRCWQ